MTRKKVLFFASTCSIPLALAEDLYQEQNPNIDVSVARGTAEIAEAFESPIDAFVIEPFPVGIAKINFVEIVDNVRANHPNTKILVWMLEQEYKEKYFPGKHDGVIELQPCCGSREIRRELYRALDIRGLGSENEERRTSGRRY